MKRKYSITAMRFVSAVTKLQGLLTASLLEGPEASMRILQEARTAHLEALRRSAEADGVAGFFHDVLRHEYNEVLRHGELILNEPDRRSYEQRALLKPDEPSQLEQVALERSQVVADIAAYYDEAADRFDVLVGLTTDYLVARPWRRNKTYRLVDGRTVRMILPLVIYPGSLEPSFEQIRASLRVDGEYVHAKEGEVSCALACFLTPGGIKRIDRFAEITFGRHWMGMKLQDRYPQSGLISE